MCVCVYMCDLSEEAEFSQTPFLLSICLCLSTPNL